MVIYRQWWSGCKALSLWLNLIKRRVLFRMQRIIFRAELDVLREEDVLSLLGLKLNLSNGLKINKQISKCVCANEINFKQSVENKNFFVLNNFCWNLTDRYNRLIIFSFKYPSTPIFTEKRVQGISLSFMFAHLLRQAFLPLPSPDHSHSDNKKRNKNLKI